MAVSQGERLLGVEWIIVVLMMTGDSLAGGAQGQLGGGKLPQPSRYFGAMIAYLMLAGLALFGPGAAKIAGRLGGVAALAIILAPPDLSKPIGPGNRPLVMRFLNLLNSYLIAGAVSQAGQTPSVANPINPKTLVPATPGPGKNTILGPGVLGGVPTSTAESGQSTYVPGGPTQILNHPIGAGGVA